MSTLFRPASLVLAVLLLQWAKGQEVRPFVFGEVHSFRSAVLQQKRTLNVYLPAGYSPDSASRYPVIYVLDGSANEDFPHLAGLAQFMNMYDLLPKSIVVGIANVDRYHDFTAPTKGDSDLVWVPTGGGSGPFIRFIAEELQPFVNRQYLTNGHNTIIGQSLGGLLCTEILFERPELFDDYIIISPSLWWNNGSLAARAHEWIGTHADISKRVFIGMAKDDDWMRPQVEAVAAAFTKGAKSPFKWTYVPFNEETHATILHRAAYRAFEWLRSEGK
jgi:predicted alpha/beta superfamily hydrolase